MSKFESLFKQLLEAALPVDTEQYYQSLNEHLRSYNMTLGENKWDKTGMVDESQMGIYMIGTDQQLGKIKRIVEGGTLILDHISAKEKGHGLVKKVYPHDEQFARDNKLKVYSELVNDYTQEAFLDTFENWNIEPREGEGVYQAVLENVTGTAFGANGAGDYTGGHAGGIPARGDANYAPNDARVATGGVTISRFGKVGGKKKEKKEKKKPKSIYYGESELRDELDTYKALKKPKQQRDQYDPIELFKGTQIEMEHTTDKNIAEIIAMNHLDEDPEYYTKLKKVEQDNPVLEAFNDNAYVFDVDDTLVTTGAKVIIRNEQGDVIDELTPEEFNHYEDKPDEIIDVSQFNSPEIFNRTAEPTKYLRVMKKMSDAIGERRSNSNLYVLTARGSRIRDTIHEYLKSKNINVHPIEIHTIGDDRSKPIAHLKRDVLERIRNAHTGEVVFFDDNEDNIRLANQVRGVKTRHVRV